MSQGASALYPGLVSHRRTRPRAHALRYRIFMLLLDLAEGPALARRLRLFGFDAPGLMSFQTRDHGDGSDTPLKVQVEQHLARAGIAGGGAVRLLCMPRVLGGVFNPLSVYFCHRPDGALSAILYEVNNTFGDRHSYLIPVAADPPGGVVRQSAEKVFFVSPFMDMELTYAFKVRPPGHGEKAGVAVSIEVADAEGLLLSASFAGERQPLDDRRLLAAWLGHPWMTLGVMGAIHWEALKIWLKGERLRPRPRAPQNPVTLAPQAQVLPA